MPPLRIVVVSALYPPNFIGGATVQAQRLARGIHARGHRVRVFAGARDARRRPLDRWDEVDETGLPVSWLVTTPWLDFDDDRNHNNPAAEDAFRAFLSEERADVVHFHALQGLGAGLLGVAKGSDARVVVTMHDWWWYCARQFLADRRLLPCCPVVDAGVCPCERDRPWLDQRRAYLDGMLEHADLVLAPSDTAARSLEANGCHPSRLAVDHNGLTDGPPPGPAPHLAASGPVTFMYAGGPFELKGVHVLLDAAELITTDKPWRVDAYGASEYAGSKGMVVRSSVRLLGPYAPHDANDVFSRADVLVVPSVARESHSLVTREALARGLAVICSDSWGPEEAVLHEVNGLVVPSADPAALAHAMQRLIDEPGLLQRLKDPPKSETSRTLDDQVDGLLEHFRKLTEPALPLRPAGVRNVLFITGIEGAPLRYRAWLPLEALRLIGIDGQVAHYRDPSVQQLAQRCDAIVVYRVPATVTIMRVLADAKERQVPLMFDVDDLIFDPGLADEIPALKILPRDEADLWLEGVRRYRITMEACDMFIGSTELLCRHATAVTGLPSERFANGVGLQQARLSDRALRDPRRDGPLRIAYLSGTDTHDRDWAYVEPGVMEAMKRHPSSELWLVGHLRPTAATQAMGDRVKRIDFQPWQRLPSLLRQIDINLAPLEPGTPFNEAKSAIKWLEAALVATPTVASPTQPFREAITHEQDGILAASSEEWTAALDSLLEDPSERARIGNRARRSALFRWSPWIQARRYAAILEIAMQSSTRTTLEKPVELPVNLIHDEPTHPYPLEPYDLVKVSEQTSPAMPTDPLSPGRSLRTELGTPAEIARVDLLASVSGKAEIQVGLHEGELKVSSGRAVTSGFPGRTWLSFALDPVASGSSIEIELRSQEEGTEVVLWTAVTGRHTAGNRQRAGEICLRLWGPVAASQRLPPDDLPAPSPREWVRAKVRYSRFVWRTKGVRGVAAWIGRAGKDRASRLRRKVTLVRKP